MVRAITGADDPRAAAAQSSGACSSAVIHDSAATARDRRRRACTKRRLRPRSRWCAASAGAVRPPSPRGNQRPGDPQPLPAGGKAGMERELSHLVLPYPAQFGAFLVGDGVQQLTGIGDNGGVGPRHAADPGHLGRDHRPRAPRFARPPGRPLRALHGPRSLDGFVAVSSTAGQTPGAALMAPHRTMLQQDRGSAVRPRGTQQQTSRAIPTPVVSAVVGYHPSVTVAMHTSRICGRGS